jgi:outer membrane protein OmpA-like peptidoglycan-associated protein
MDGYFGRDFSQVRVHTDAPAAESALRVGARAYTVGQDIVFGAGQFASQTVDGQKLLVHELTHVAQPQVAGSRGISQPGDASEREADRATDAFTRGETLRVGASLSAVVQRQPLPNPKSASHSDTLIENASPILAAALGSTTLDHFDTGKSDLKPDHKSQLAFLAHTIQILLDKYNLSTITVIGHADTLGPEGNNRELGQDRADVVKRALADLGIPDSIISAESKGEAPPQAVKTKSEVSNPRNRRVEVRFHPRASHLGLMTERLNPPSFQPKSPASPGPGEKPPIDFTYHPKPVPLDPTRLPPDFWKPIPPAPKGTGPKSPLDVIAEKILDPVIDAVAGKLPKNLREKIKEGARDAVKSGIAKGARAAAEAAGLKDPEGLEAIEKAAEAAIQEKGKSPR